MTSPEPADHRLHLDGILRWVDTLRAGHYTFHLPPAQSLYVRHRNMLHHTNAEFFIQHRGTTEFRCPDFRFDLRESESCLIRTGLPHGEIVRCNEQGRFQAQVLYVKDARLVSLLSYGTDGEAPSIEQAHSFESPEAQKALAHIEELATIHPQKHQHASFRTDALLRAFAGSVADIIENSRTPPQRNETRVYRAQNYIQEHLSDPELSVAQIAQFVDCSADHLTRIFRAHFSRTPNRYIRGERLRFARALIQRGGLNLGEIADLSGFRSLNYFSRAFAQAVGYPPSEHRQRSLDHYSEARSTASSR